MARTRRHYLPGYAWDGVNPPEFGQYFQRKSSLHFFTENRPVPTVNPHAFAGNPARCHALWIPAKSMRE